MPAPAVHALTIPQWGMEGNKAPNTPGAAVAATKKMAVKDFLIRPTDEIVRDAILKGLLIGNRGDELIVARGTEWEVPETPLVFDEFHYWLAMLIRGTGSVVVGPPITWTFTLDPLVLNGRDLRTIEARLTDGSNNSDWELTGAYLTELEVIAAANQPVKFTARGAARRLVTSTLTAALTLPGIVEIPSALTRVQIDSTWAARGSTQVASQVMGWRFKMSSGIFGQMTMDQRTDLDYTVAVINPDNVRWSVEIDLKANLNTGQWQTEKTAAEAGTLRAVVLHGAITVGGVNYDFKIQALAKYTLASVFPEGRENGEVTAKLVLEGSTDNTNALAVILQNNTSAAIA